MKDYLTPVSVSVIALIIEHYITHPLGQPKKSFTGTGKLLVLAAVVSFPAAALILVCASLWLILSQQNDIVQALNASPLRHLSVIWEGQNIDVIALIILLYSMFILLLLFYHQGVARLSSLKASLSKDRQEQLKDYCRTHSEEEIESEAVLHYNLQSRERINAYLSWEIPESLKLNDKETLLSADLAIMKTVFLFQPLFLVWFHIYVTPVTNVSFYILLLVCPLVFNFIYLHRYRNEAQRIPIIEITLESLLQREIILWTSLILGILLFPIFLMVYRVEDDMLLSWKLLVFGLGTAFLLIPLLWRLFFELYRRTLSPFIRYLFKPLLPTFFRENH